MLPLIAPGEQKSHPPSLVCLFSPVKVDPGINPMIADPGLDIRHPSLNLPSRLRSIHHPLFSVDSVGWRRTAQRLPLDPPGITKHPRGPLQANVISRRGCLGVLGGRRGGGASLLCQVWCEGFTSSMAGSSSHRRIPFWKFISRTWVAPPWLISLQEGEPITARARKTPF